MNVASALPQNSVLLSGGILPPSKSATATVEAEGNGVRVHDTEPDIERAGVATDAGAGAIFAATDVEPDCGARVAHAAMPMIVESATTRRVTRRARGFNLLASNIEAAPTRFAEGIRAKMVP